MVFFTTVYLHGTSRNKKPCKCSFNAFCLLFIYYFVCIFISFMKQVSFLRGKELKTGHKTALDAKIGTKALTRVWLLQCLRHFLPLQGSSSFELNNSSMIFLDFFHDLFKFSMTLGLVVTLKNFHNFPSLGVFFDLKQFNRHILWCLQKWVPFALFNYSSLSYIFLALSSAVTKLLNKTLNFHDFQGPTIISMTFQGWKMKLIVEFRVFPGFPWPVRTLPLRWCYMRRFATTIFRATQRCNAGAML